MGNIAVTRGRYDEDKGGEHKKVTLTIAMASSYATSGDSFLTADIDNIIPGLSEDMTKIDHIHLQILTGQGLVTTLVPDLTNKKVLAYNGTTQISSTTNLSTVTAKVLITYNDLPAARCYW